MAIGKSKGKGAAGPKRSGNGPKSAQKRSGWVKPDGTPLRKRKGDYFPDREIEKRTPAYKKKRNDLDHPLPKPDSSGPRSESNPTERSISSPRGKSDSERRAGRDDAPGYRKKTFDRPSDSKFRSDRRDDDKKHSTPGREKPFSSDRDKPFSREGDKPFSREGKKPYSRDRDKPFSAGRNKPFSRDRDKPYSAGGDKPFSRDRDKPSSAGGDKPYSRDRDKPFSRDRDKPYSDRDKSSTAGGDKPFSSFRKPLSKRSARPGGSGGRDGFRRGKRDEAPYRTRKPRAAEPSAGGAVRLNKFIANAGICSRREADDLITAGVISVNGEIVTELGSKVMPGDTVKFHDRTLKTEKPVYVLLNKPKDFITTTDDPQERKTVMSLVQDACRERILPVGRLDRNTTGLLLFTNDGDLTKRLTHPGGNIKKIYTVELDRNISRDDMQRTLDGIELEDGPAAFDAIEYDMTGEKNIVGVELHSGRNRVVRRVFEAMDYKVKKLDRVMFAELTKKDLPRGRWRFLTELEVSSLKMMTGKK